MCYTKNKNNKIMDKRTFLKTGLLLGAGSLIAGPAIAGTKKFMAESDSDNGNEFKQDELKYAYNALEPYIDAKTMELHYSKHHAGYTRKFNAAIKENNLERKPIKEIFSNISKYLSSVRNNGGGYYNHNMFWSVMSPNGGGEPTGKLKTAIDKSFGSFENFKKEFSAAAGTVFGSGWAWLILKDGQLKITKTSNQDNPLMDVVEEKGKPIMCIDVWEHAYYLNYQNMRSDYIQAFWNVVDWEYVGNRMNG
jgi:Fe-Mn family superoxide dismutase